MPATSNAAWYRKVPGTVHLAVAGVLALYTLLLVFGLGRPPSWADEVGFIDPGANLYLHGRFITSVWPYQTVDDVFFGNAPLLSLLLGGWFKLVGFGLFQARILSWIFACGGMIAGLAAIRRSDLLPERYLPWLAVLFLTGYGLCFNIWNVRYDKLDFALVAAVLFGLSGEDTTLVSIVRRAALFLIPSAGFHLVFVVGFLYALPVVFSRRLTRSQMIDLAWLVAGGLALLVFFGITVGLRRFVFLTLFSDHTLLGQAARGASGRGALFFVTDKVRRLLAVFVQDPSYTVALAVCGLLALRAHTRPDRAPPSRIYLCLWAGALILPLGLCFIGKYPVYYSWIGWSCVCVLFFQLLDMARLGAAWRNALTAAAVCALSFGLGLFTYLRHVETGTPTAQDHADLAAAITGNIGDQEVVYADYASYFEAWRRARFVYAASYAQNHFLPGFPTVAPVTAMIVQERDFAKVRGLVGGDWRCVWRARAPWTIGASTLELCKRVAPPAGRAQ